MHKNYTREELHQMVWERPMTKVAADLKISDIALAKICKGTTYLDLSRGIGPGWLQESLFRKSRCPLLKTINLIE
jgi:hypothetical protein